MPQKLSNAEQYELQRGVAARAIEGLMRTPAPMGTVPHPDVSQYPATQGATSYGPAQLKAAGTQLLYSLGGNPYGPPGTSKYGLIEDTAKQQQYMLEHAAIGGPGSAGPKLSKAARALIKTGGAQLVKAHEVSRGAYYIDELGNVLKLAGDDHGEALIKAGLATAEDAWQPLTGGRHKLVRARALTDDIGIEIAHEPSAAQRNALESMIFSRQPPDGPGAKAGFDFITSSAAPSQRGRTETAEEFVRIMKRMKWR